MTETKEHEIAIVLLALGNPNEAKELEEELNRRFPGGLEIYQAPSGFDAMSLAMNRPRVVLLDQRLPDVMGLDMIDPIRDQIGKENYLIFIGGSGKGGMRPGMRDEALKRGATSICDRPIEIDWLVEMLRQLLYPEIPPHPHLHGLELLDLIQAFHVKRVNRTLRIFARDGRVGSIYMQNGEITHIEAGGMLGFNAMLDLMQWTEGDIIVYDALLSAEKTNKDPTYSLLLEAARIMDEGGDASQRERERAAEEEEPRQGPSGDATADALDAAFAEFELDGEEHPAQSPSAPSPDEPILQRTPSPPPYDEDEPRDSVKLEPPPGFRLDLTGEDAEAALDNVFSSTGGDIEEEEEVHPIDDLPKEADSGEDEKKRKKPEPPPSTAESEDSLQIPALDLDTDFDL